MHALQHRHLGMSLVELMVVLAIVSVLALASAPFLGSTIGSNRIENGADQLAASFRFARGEALSTGLPTTVCSSSDSATCTATPWAQGWIVYRSNGANQEVLQAVTPSNQVTIDNPAAAITFNSVGAVTDPAGGAVSFVITDSKSSLTRNITVSQVGRVSKQ